MIRFLIVLALLGSALYWLLQFVLANPGTTTITWGLHAYEMKTATLTFAVLVLCIVFYLTVTLLRQILGLRKRLHQLRGSRLSSKANRSLNQGLIQLTEGHWEKAEKLLTEHASYREAPLLNYLAAARAAHMQDAPERRDSLLRQAIASDSKAQIAVGVSQAEMQMSTDQIEQAHATLLNLRALAPKNAYVLKLMAKVLHKRESWESLLDILPELQKQNLLNTENMIKVKAATLQGLFSQYSAQKDPDKLQTLWKKLPTAIREQAEAQQVFAAALHTAGADAQCAQFIVSINNKALNHTLTSLYGRLQHPNLPNAIQQAEKWLAQAPDNPNNLLLLARLHHQQKLWGVSKSYYESSLNQSPEVEGYLELAELLETMGEQENAEHCYRVGLRYAIRQQGERLTLAPSQRQKKNAEVRQAAPTF